MKRLLFALILATLACGRTVPRELNLYPSPTPDVTQTAFVVEITTTPVSTYTPIVQIVTEEPAESLCVDAVVAVHLRPSPSNQNYPISVLLNKTVLEDLGGRSGEWVFVKHGEQSGWVHSDYVVACNKTQ